MTEAQQAMVINLVQEFEEEDGMKEVHHGDCVGSDNQFHDIILEHTKANIHIHPGTDNFGEMPKRAHCKGPTERIRMYDPKPYLARNIDIVKAGDALLATPQQAQMVTRSGTWSTVRKAKRYQKALYVILPDGYVLDAVEEE
jgi:hypothetical protein